MSINQNFPEVSPSLLLDFANSKTLDPRITFARASIGTYVASNGLIKTAAADEPRFDHDPATGESLGLLIEESRTNLVDNSTDFISSWTINESTTSSNVGVSPDNSLTADSIIPTTTSNVIHRIYKVFTVPISTIYTFSFFIKPFGYNKIFLRIGGQSNSPLVVWNTSTKTIDFSAGIFISSSIQEYPNGWYRVSLTINTNSTSYAPNIGAVSDSFTTNNVNEVIFTGDGNSGAYFWGAQFEVGSFPTTYIPTSGSTVTRQPDEASILGTNFTNIFNTSEGTFVAECDRGNDGTESNAIGVMRRSADNYYDMIQFGEFYDNGGFVGRIFAGNGSPQSANSLIGATHTTGQGIYNRYAFTYKTDDVAGVINGIIQDTDNSASLPTQLDRFLFGNYNDSRTNNNLDGHIKYLHYYPQRLTNDQLQNLTK